MILRVVQRSGGISRPATQRLLPTDPGACAQYARLKLAGLDDAPCHIAVFADRETTQGHGLGRYTMSEMIEYSAVAAVHTLWLAARAEGIGMGWVSILDPRTITAILDVPPTGS
jgi:5,6-dimethylbenzimidazole synthase